MWVVIQTLLVFLFLSTFEVDGQRKGAVKEVPPLSERVQQLTDLSAKRSVIRFNAERFRTFVKAVPKNYSVIVQFTALSPARSCSLCRQANDEFTIVANSWRYSASFRNNLFFAMVDFDEGQEVFQQMGFNSAPILMHFPEKGKPKKGDNMDIQRIGFQAEVIAKWIQERTDNNIRVFRPPNYSGTIAILVFVAMVGSFLYVRRHNLEFIYNRKTWGLTALLIVFFMISGQMWNHIRGPPLLQRTQRGISYIHSSSSGQFIMETYIVMTMYACVSCGLLLMNEAPLLSQGETKTKNLFSLGGLSLFVVFFSFLLSVFRSKAHGYPYSLLFS